MASRVGLIPVRLQIWPTADTADADRVQELKRNQTDMFTVGAVKLIIDGSIQAYTGYLTEPYYVAPKDQGADYRGHALIPKDKLIERVENYHSRGIQMALHGNGDAAIDDILMSPAQSAESADLRYSIHLDSPVVPMEPMRLVWSAVNRQTFAGNSIGPQQRISPLQALRATTINAAWQIFKESELGSIEIGKFADLIVLDQNPLLVPQGIDQIKVLRTYIGGREVFNRSE